MDWITSIFLFIARLLLIMAFSLFSAFLVEWLWNLIVPGLFGLPELTYWKTVGLVAIIKLLSADVRIDYNNKTR